MAEREEPLSGLEELLSAEVEVEAVLGEKRVPLRDLAQLAEGGDLCLRLVAAGVEIGEGIAVEVDGRLALQVERVHPPETFLAQLGGEVRRRLRGREHPSEE
jgi:flagellar motor switch/type III secretory pathway protein FliN